MNTLLFVYGTLRRHALLQQHAEFLGEATTDGVLYDMGGYPGLKRGAPAILPAPVPGELYEVREESWSSVIAQFDDYEGAEYTRELVPVRTSKGDLVAWTYIYTGPVKGFSAITAWPPK